MTWRREFSWILVFVFLLFIIVGGLIFILSVPTTEETIDPNMPVITANDPVIGAENPRVVVVFFSEFSCEYCADIWNSLELLLEDYPEDLAIVWKDFPNESLRPESVPAAIGARCAGDQGAFWEFTSAAYEERELTEETITTVATTLELNERKFSSCLNKQTHLDIVRENVTEGVRLNLTGSPTLFINGKRYTGLLTTRELADVIEAALP